MVAVVTAVHMEARYRALVDLAAAVLVVEFVALMALMALVAAVVVPVMTPR